MSIPKAKANGGGFWSWARNMLRGKWRTRIDSPPPLRIRLDYEDFDKLVRGETVTVYSENAFANAHIILADIGWDMMLASIKNASDPNTRNRSTWDDWCAKD